MSIANANNKQGRMQGKASRQDVTLMASVDTRPLESQITRTLRQAGLAQWRRAVTLDKAEWWGDDVSVRYAIHAARPDGMALGEVSRDGSRLPWLCVCRVCFWAGTDMPYDPPGHAPARSPGGSGVVVSERGTDALLELLRHFEAAGETPRQPARRRRAA